MPDKTNKIKKLWQNRPTEWLLEIAIVSTIIVIVLYYFCGWWQYLVPLPMLIYGSFIGTRHLSERQKEQRLTRYQNSLTNIGSNSLAVQNGAIDDLFKIAKNENKETREEIFNILITFLCEKSRILISSREKSLISTWIFFIFINK